MSDKTVGVGMIGYAFMGRAHSQAWRNVAAFFDLPVRPSMRVVAGRTKEATEAAAEQLGWSEAVTDWREVVGRADVDIVDICTPGDTHAEIAIAALRAGKHVICEKPLTSSLKLTDAIIEAERKSTARVMPIFQYRFEDGFWRIRQLLATGIAGKPYIASVETAWKRGPDYYSVPWRGRFATELGGVLVTQSIHIHDLFLTLFGPVAQVKAFKTTRVNAVEVEDCAVASLRMESGALASLVATLGSQEPVTRIRLCFEKLTIERQCFGDEAPRPGREPWKVVPRDPQTAEAIAALPPYRPLGMTGFAGQFSAFHAALAAGSPFPVTLADARRALELVSAIYHASETDEAVTMPIAASHPRYEGWISERSLHPASSAA